MRLSLLLLLATSPAALAGGLSPSGLILSDGGLSSQSAPTVVDDDPLVMRPDLLGSLGDDDVLSRAKALIEAAGLDGVGRRGRIDMRDLTLRTGAYLLNEDGCGGSSSLPPPAPSGGGLTASCSTLTGTFAAWLGSSQSVTRYTGETFSDTAVILADEVVFDEATLTLSDSVRELWIIADTLTSTDSEITWEHAGTRADARSSYSSCADDGVSYNATRTTSASAFDSPDGGAGDDGLEGANGYGGLDAPDVYIVVRNVSYDSTNFVQLPTLDLRGQAGGRAQNGQCAGDGGDGAKGSDAVQNLFNCTQGVGWGGDGGEGGDGGNGGDGGVGGDGGDVVVRYVERVTGWFDGSAMDRSGGDGGSAGSGGRRGYGGDGGEAGDGRWPYCVDEPGRAGDDGGNGSSGSSGAYGSDGSRGTFDSEEITESEWETWIGMPWLVRAEDTEVYVGSSLTFHTENISTGATLNLVDDVDGSSHALSLSADGTDIWTLADTSSLEAGVYTVSITRDDGETTENEVGIELLPVVDEVVFEDPYDAVPGGTAYLVGAGLRQDTEILWDGVSVGSGLRTTYTDGREALAFTLPIEATDGARFVREDGVTPHTVELDQPYPLANSDAVEVTLLRSAGLTFRPSTHAYSFSNGDLTPFAKAEANATPWRSFRQTYGGVEVDAKAALSPILTSAQFGLWSAWWAPSTGSANCMGMSSNVLNDYFSGVTGVSSYVETDVAYNVMLAQGHLLSREFLSGLAGETLLADFTESAVVGGITDFMEHGTDADGDDALVIIMVPTSEVYADALVHILDQTDDAHLVDTAEDIAEAFTEVGTAIGSSHALAPFMVVYDDPTDTTPSRIYFYDSNAPGEDEVFMEISTDTGEITWDYTMFYNPTDPDPYGYGSSLDWLLGGATVGAILGDVSLVF